jgi:hypothetical protein
MAAGSGRTGPAVAGRAGPDADPVDGRLEACAATLVWLVSSAGGYVTGHTIVVDGGASIA